MKRRDILISRLKAKQKIRKLIEARKMRQQQVNNVTNSSSLQLQPPTQSTPTNQPVGFGGDDGPIQ